MFFVYKQRDGISPNLLLYIFFLNGQFSIPPELYFYIILLVQFLNFIFSF